MPQDDRKMVFDRIQTTENYFGELCSELSSYTRKKARLRDKYDELARIFKGYADTVRFNETLFNGLLNYSKSCTLLADAKDIEIQRLQLHTIHDLAAYENVCKNARESLKHSLLQRGKEQLRQRAQQRNQDQNNGAIEESKTNNEFETNLVAFERQKVNDIRRILLDFTLIQLKESVKSVEILTTLYNDVTSIDVDKDLEEFDSKVLNKSLSKLDRSNRSQSMSALANNKQNMKRTNLSNSTMSLSSPNKDIDSNVRNDRNRLSESESDDDETVRTTEETSESEEEQSEESSLTKPSTENHSSSYEDDDDDKVRVHSIKEAIKKKPKANLERTAPTPHVRFSKLVGHIK